MEYRSDEKVVERVGGARSHQRRFCKWDARNIHRTVVVSRRSLASFLGRSNPKPCIVDEFAAELLVFPLAGRTKQKKEILHEKTKLPTVIIEDIVDTGLTAQFIRRYFEDEGAATVSICSLLDKPARRLTSVTVEYVGFEVPDQFLVGYGLDYNQEYRELRDIYSLEGVVDSGGRVTEDI